jgi:hypothetical protein
MTLIPFLVVNQSETIIIERLGKFSRVGDTAAIQSSAAP